MKKFVQFVAEFGLCQPTENADLANDQIARANALYNTVADIAQAGRRRLKRVECTIPDLAACHARHDAGIALVEALYAQKKQAQSYDWRVTAPRKSEIDAAKAERNAAGAALRKTRAKYRAQLNPVEDEICEEYGAGERGGFYGTRVSKAINESGVYWGTYLKTLQALRQAGKDVTSQYMPDGRPRKYTPHEERPKLRTGVRLDNGLVAIHVQNRVLPAEGLFGTDTFVRIDPLPANAFDTNVPRCQRNKLQRTTLHMRIGSNGRKPIWASWPLFMHRALPEGATVIWATVIRIQRKQRFRYEWKLQLTLAVPEAPPKMTGEACAVNLGWRRMHGEPLLGRVEGPTQDGELRVATWADTAGEEGEIRLGSSFRDRIRRSWRIRSERDRLTDVLRDDLCSLNVPCDRWRSPRRFHALLDEERARAGKPEYDAHRIALLETWARRDKHLYWFERGCREGALNYRRDVYRHFALFCAEAYKAVVIENYDIRDISEDKDKPKGPGVQRVASAPSVMRQILHSTSARLGCSDIEGESYRATQRCHVCGCEESWDAAPHVKHTCPNGHTWDQDVNNAINMLANARVMLKTLDPLAVRKPKKGAAFAKRHKKHDDAGGEKKE